MWQPFEITIQSRTLKNTGRTIWELHVAEDDSFVGGVFNSEAECLEALEKNECTRNGDVWTCSRQRFAR